ncbi:hypothetical protein [Natronospora cellulosivora (SeqCode)]
MNKKLYSIFMGITFILCLILGVFLSKYFIWNSSKEIYYQNESYSETIQILNDLDIPLPIPSAISYEKNNIRLDLEKVAVNKFFIVYSVIYGNQSHTAYHLYLTNLNKESIDKSEIQEVYLKTKDDEIIKPVAQRLTIRDFPEDIPLGWKVQIIAKLPYQTEKSAHKLILIYNNQEYILSNIYY